MTMNQEDGRISVLLVEDHHVTMEGLQSWMEKTNAFRIVGKTGNAEAVVEIARTTRPRVTLLDLHLPGKYSLEQLVKDLVDTGTKVVVFSAEDRKYFIDLVIKCGASAFVSKSESYATISKVINDVCNTEGRYLSAPQKQAYRCRFTDAEQDLLSLLAKGKKYEEISSIRLTSPHTVRKQCDKLQLKLGLPSREALIAWSVENGYAAVPETDTQKDS